MNASEAALAKENGIKERSEFWIKKIQEDWEEVLKLGRDNMWIEYLNNEVGAVQKIVENHFQELGYGFEEEVHYRYYNDEWHHRMRITPKDKIKPEPGIFSRLLRRIFGGSHD